MQNVLDRLVKSFLKNITILEENNVYILPHHALKLPLTKSSRTDHLQRKRLPLHEQQNITTLEFHQPFQP